MYMELLNPALDFSNYEKTIAKCVENDDYVLPCAAIFVPHLREKVGATKTEDGQFVFQRVFDRASLIHQISHFQREVLFPVVSNHLLCQLYDPDQIQIQTPKGESIRFTRNSPL